MYKVVLVLLCVLLSIAPSLDVFAQKASTNKKAQQSYENASKYLQLNNYNLAIEELKKAIQQDDQFATAYQQLADIYRSKKNYLQAVPYYEKVMQIDPNLTPLTLFGLGESLLHSGRYAAAIPNFEQYLKSNISDKTRNLVHKYLLDCQFSLQHPNSESINLERLQPTVNTANDEYFPKLTADNHHIIFTRKENNQENFYESERTTAQQWREATKLIGAVNSDLYNEGAHCISPDGKYLFFTGCNRPNGLGSCDIYVSKKENGQWSAATNLGAPINTKGWEAQPAISADGRTLYFVSNRAGGIGGNDIWKSVLGDNGLWQAPTNLGPSINTVYDEGSPYIHADNQTLYFSSNGWPGYAGQDLYRSTLNEAMLWSTPLNLGKPINNHFNQTAIHVSMNGDLGFFSTQDSTYQLDIFSFKLPTSIKPHPVAYIAGTVLDKNSKRPLAAKITVTNTMNHKKLFEDQSDEQDGKFIATLPLGANYAVHIQSKGYLFDSKQYDLKNHDLANEKFEAEILLSPIQAGNIARLNNIYFEVNKYELLSESQSDLLLLLAFLKTNPAVHIEVAGHTDNTGAKINNQLLSENRAQAVVQYLLENGIDKFRIYSKGYGDQSPISTNETQEGKQLNRRTEIKIIK